MAAALKTRLRLHVTHSGPTAEISVRCGDSDASILIDILNRPAARSHCSVLLSPLLILFSEPKFILFRPPFSLHPTLSALISVGHPPSPFPFGLLIFLFMMLLMMSAAAQCAAAISELFHDRALQPRCSPHSCLTPKHIRAHLHALFPYTISHHTSNSGEIPVITF